MSRRSPGTTPSRLPAFVKSASHARTWSTPWGSAVVVDGVREATAGVYVVQILPLAEWTDGTYLFVLTVEARHDRGQTIVPLVIPPL